MRLLCAGRAVCVAAWLGLAWILALALPCSAQADGLARGMLAEQDWPGLAYGFSAYSQQWTSTPLVGTILKRDAGDYIAAILTTERAYAYKPANDRWICDLYDGHLCGLDADGTTAVYWTSSGCAAIASIWTVWRRESFGLGEVARGAGSAGCFALVWTTQRALAYNASTGQWQTQELLQPPLSGITSNGIGLVWTSRQAFAFCPTSDAWTEAGLVDPIGLCAGSGCVGLVWGEAEAAAYSQTTGAWCPVETPGGPFRSGAAHGRVALVWTDEDACAFNADTGQWTAIGHVSGIGADDDETARLSDAPEVFGIDPNPCAGLQLRLRLPGRDAWRVAVFDLTGRQVRRIDVPGAVDGSTLAWDRTDDAGVPLPPGSYWIRAQSAAGSVEARRIVLLP